MRGAHQPPGAFVLPGPGPSPRAWGSQPRSATALPHRWSIPTCVGLTVISAPSRIPLAVHPHVRGAHDRIRALNTVHTRSIPTCVGLTRRVSRRAGRAAVHPHVRGAHPPRPSCSRVARRSIPTCVGLTHTSRLFRFCPGGPSPRAWGSLTQKTVGTAMARSIPTCVGLTELAGLERASFIGPSPRAWGSPASASSVSCRERSIPTCVGLTPCRGDPPQQQTVHPHVRGAHPPECGSRRAPDGPSPRAWGSLGGGALREDHNRSIPTCVGLTAARISGGRVAPVHPHVRGAHSEGVQLWQLRVGPSPRAWGSRNRGKTDIVEGRSIPTCVGLTPPADQCPGDAPVHPHVRGAHWIAPVADRGGDGPSPRAWGSRAAHLAWGDAGRSIPTCVGLTASAVAPAGNRWVHPHVRGAHGQHHHGIHDGSGPSPRAWGSHGG